MNIKRIIREELEGLKNSSEEDWEWAKDALKPLPLHRDINNDKLYVGDAVKIIVDYDDHYGDIVTIERLLGPDDGWDEGGNELAYGHCGTEENGGCITTYDFGSRHYVGHEFELVERGNMFESEGFLDSSDEDWEQFKNVEEEDYSGYYVFNPPINKDQWLDVLNTMENGIPNIVWSSGNELSNSINMFPGITEIYGLSINIDYSEGKNNGNKLRALSNLTWGGSDKIYNKMNNSKLPTHDGREFFDI